MVQIIHALELPVIVGLFALLFWSELKNRKKRETEDLKTLIKTDIVEQKLELVKVVAKIENENTRVFYVIELNGKKLPEKHFSNLNQALEEFERMQAVGSMQKEREIIKSRSIFI